MAAPTTQTRVAPNGIALTDGYSCRITLAVDTDIEFWEKTLQPPGFDGGDMIDQTTMFNSNVRTQLPRSLYTLTDLTFTAAYDPKVLDSILSAINVNTDVTVLFSNNDTWDFYGALRQFTPQEMSEGAQPEAEVIISPTNWDPDANVEAVPNYITSLGSD